MLVKARLKIFIPLFLGLVLLGFVPLLSFASPVEDVYPLDMPSSRLFVFHDNNNVADVIDPSSQSQNSGFLNNATFKPYFASNVDKSTFSNIVTFTYPYDADFYTGFVYQIEVVVHNAIWSSSLDFDPSNVMFSLSAKYPTTDQLASLNKLHLDEYFPWFFKPVKVTSNSSRWVLTYNVPFYASNFSGWLPVDNDGKVVCSTFGFYDQSDSLGHSLVLTSGLLTTNYRFGLYSVKVTKMTESEALAWAIENNGKIISDAISAQTISINNTIEDQTDRIISGEDLQLPDTSDLQDIDDEINSGMEMFRSTHPFSISQLNTLNQLNLEPFRPAFVSMQSWVHAMLLNPLIYILFMVSFGFVILRTLLRTLF